MSVHASLLRISYTLVSLRHERVRRGNQWDGDTRTDLHLISGYLRINALSSVPRQVGQCIHLKNPRILETSVSYYSCWYRRGIHFEMANETLDLGDSGIGRGVFEMMGLKMSIAIILLVAAVGWVVRFVNYRRESQKLVSESELCGTSTVREL